VPAPVGEGGTELPGRLVSMKMMWRWLFVGLLWLCAWGLLSAPLGLTASPEVLVITHRAVKPYAEVLQGMEEGWSDRISFSVLDTYEDTAGIRRHDFPQAVVAIGPDAAGLALTEFPETPLVLTYVLDAEQYARRAGSRPAMLISMLADPERIFSSLTEILPGARRVGVIYSFDLLPDYRRRAEEMAYARGFELITYEVADPRTVLRVLPKIIEETDVFWWIPSPKLFPAAVQEHMLEQSYRQRVPVIGSAEKATRQGALFSLSVSNRALGLQLGQAVQGLLDAPLGQGFQIRYPSEPVLTLNRRIKEHLGLVLPQGLEQNAKIYGEF